LGDDEAVLFADAVHPTHAARPAGCWAPKQEKLAIEQTSGRDRINIHGAIDLATGQTRMIEVVTVDAVEEELKSVRSIAPVTDIAEHAAEPTDPVVTRSASRP
jgi:hypothetical protein